MFFFALNSPDVEIYKHSASIEINYKRKQTNNNYIVSKNKKINIIPASKTVADKARKKQEEEKKKKQKKPEDKISISTSKNKELVLNELLKIHSKDKLKEYSFDNFLNDFTEDAIKKNIFSFPITDISQIKDPKTRKTPKIIIPESVKFHKAITTPGVRASVLPKLGVDLNGVSRITEKVEENSLLWLPKPYLIGGSFHKELYPHDTSYSIWALLESSSAKKYTSIIKDQLENFSFQTKYFGFPLNGNRGYQVTRSQNNIIPSNVYQYYKVTKDKKWLETTGLPMAEKIFSYWTSDLATVKLGCEEEKCTEESLAGYKWLAHGNGPCLEVLDSHKEHKHYYFKVLKILIKNLELVNEERLDYAKDFDYSKVVEKLKEKPKEKVVYTLKGGFKGLILESPASKYKNGEPVVSYMNNYYKLTDFYYLSDRENRTSGYDTCHLYGPFNSFTNNFIPSDHNLLLYRNANDIANSFKALGNTEKFTYYDKKAKDLKKMILKTLWGGKTFYEYDYKNRILKTNYPFASSGYGLWAHIFNIKKDDEKQMLLNMVKFFEKRLEGGQGFYSSGVKTGLHWDKPYIWPIQQGYIVSGLRDYANMLRGEGDLKNADYLTRVADRIAIKFLIANYSDWLLSKGTKVGEKVLDGNEHLLTGYAAGSNYTWNLATVLYLYSTLSEELKTPLESLLN